MKRRKYNDHHAFDEYGILRDQRSVKVPMFCMDAAQTAGQHFTQLHDGTGDSALGLHRPGFRVTDIPPSEELQRAHDDYVQDLTTAWRRGAGNKEVVPNAHKASNNDAEPVQDMETMYRRYAEEISQAWKAPR